MEKQGLKPAVPWWFNFDPYHLKKLFSTRAPNAGTPFRWFHPLHASFHVTPRDDNLHKQASAQVKNPNVLSSGEAQHSADCQAGHRNAVFEGGSCYTFGVCPRKKKKTLIDSGRQTTVHKLEKWAFHMLSAPQVRFLPTSVLGLWQLRHVASREGQSPSGQGCGKLLRYQHVEDFFYEMAYPHTVVGK